MLPVSVGCNGRLPFAGGVGPFAGRGGDFADHFDPFPESAVTGLVGRMAFGEVSPLGTSAHPAKPSLDPEDAH